MTVYAGMTTLAGMTKFFAGMTVYTGMMFLFFIPIAFAQNVFQHSNQLMNIDEEIESYTDPIILRARKAVLDRSQLLNSALNNQSIHLNLFGDVDLKATLKKSSSSSPGSAFLSGSLEQGGHITLFISKEGIIRGEVHSPRGTYTIRTSKGERGSQNVIIRQVDTSQLPVIDHGAMTNTENLKGPEKSSSDFSVYTNGGHGKFSSGTFNSDDWIPASAGMTANGVEEESSDQTVDILVVYTPNAEAHEGGKAEIEATITAEIEKTNQAFNNSGLSHRKIRLVAMEKVDYMQVDNNMSDNLRVLREKKGSYYDPDGILDEVYEMRERYSADLGHLFVERAIGTCGIANKYALYDKNSVGDSCKNDPNIDECIIRRRKEIWRYKSFSVSAIPDGCTIQNTFTHELGHNFGLFHDRYVENYLSLDNSVNFPIVAYGFGYVNQNFSRSECFRTIMAYGNQCIDEGYTANPRALMFSNPDVELGSEDVGFDPAGVDGDEWTVELDGPVNAARAIDEVWDIVASLYNKKFLVPLFPHGASPNYQGFIRIINHSNKAGTINVTAYDDEGNTYDPVTIDIGADSSTHFNSTDLEQGNTAKGLTGSTGQGQGEWRLEIESEDLNIEVLSYIRTTDGFVTSMHELALKEGTNQFRLPMFNPASNVNQVSSLRLINPHEEEISVSITGIDDNDLSPGSTVEVTLPAGSAKRLTSQELESGVSSDITSGNLGNGSGKWQLLIESDKPILAMSLMESPTGHLSNLSGMAKKISTDSSGVSYMVPFFPAHEDAKGRQGFVRVTNHSDENVSVSIKAFDSAGVEYSALSLSVDAGKTRHFNSMDLELGNTGKGLTGSTGQGQGEWRLTLSSEEEDIDVMSYVRTPGGFLTSMHDMITEEEGGLYHRVAFFNPGSNNNQVSVLYVINLTEQDAAVSVSGVDGAGNAPGTDVTFTVPAGKTKKVTAQELEAGAEGLTGALGDGSSKWQLKVRSDISVIVMSLLENPTGHLTNLSTAP